MFLACVLQAKRGSVEEASGSERVKSAPETDRQASRSTQQADVDAENAELQTPKLLSKAGRAPGGSPPGVAAHTSSVHGGSGVKSPGSKSVAAHEGRGAAGGLTVSEDGAGSGLKQAEVDAESAALQLPDVAKAAQQVSSHGRAQRPLTLSDLKMTQFTRASKVYKFRYKGDRADVKSGRCLTRGNAGEGG